MPPELMPTFLVTVPARLRTPPADTVENAIDPPDCTFSVPATPVPAPDPPVSTPPERTVSTPPALVEPLLRTVPAIVAEPPLPTVKNAAEPPDCTLSRPPD